MGKMDLRMSFRVLEKSKGKFPKTGKMGPQCSTGLKNSLSLLLLALVGFGPIDVQAIPTTYGIITSSYSSLTTPSSDPSGTALGFAVGMGWVVEQVEYDGGYAAYNSGNVLYTAALGPNAFVPFKTVTFTSPTAPPSFYLRIYNSADKLTATHYVNLGIDGGSDYYTPSSVTSDSDTVQFEGFSRTTTDTSAHGTWIATPPVKQSQDVPFSDGFEGAADGEDLGAGTTWSGDGTILATTNENPTGWFAGYPLTTGTHSAALAFTDGASILVDGVTGEGVYIDYLIRPTFTNAAPTLASDAQFALYFDINGVANLYHTFEEPAFPYAVTHRWTPLANVDPINAGEWVRVTYQMFYEHADYTYFKMWINGIAVANSSGYEDLSAFPLVTGGTSFINADCGGYQVLGETKITSFDVYGSGVLDDVVVTDGDIAPFVAESAECCIMTLNRNTDGGSINPEGLTVIDAGDDFTVTITPNTGYKSSVSVDDGGAIETYSIEFADVQADHTIRVDFIAKAVYSLSITNRNPSGGSVDPVSSTNVFEGEDLAITLTPNPGYKSSVSVDGSPLVETYAIDFIDIQAEHAVVVDFIAVVPVITDQPVSAVAATGSAASLSVSNSGPGPFGYQWLKDGVILSGQTNSTLSITSFQVTDCGNYSVVITNAQGMAISFPASLSTPDATLWAWGGNDDGELGDGTTNNTSRPVQVVSNAVAAASGVYYSLCVKADGTLWATGRNNYGQLGNGTNTDTNQFVQVASNVVSAACGHAHSLFVKADGTLWAMGRNDRGQLGDGTTTDTNRPILVTSNVVSVACGSWHSLFVKADGTLWAMGANDWGQLGDGTTSMWFSPAPALPVQVASNVVSAAGGKCTRCL